MATRIDDRWLWLGLGAFTFVAIKGVAKGLRTIIDLTEVHEPAPPEPPTIPAAALNPHVGKESAIKTASLETLATCSNIEIRKAATKILCERFFAHQPSRERLLKELGSSNERVQHRAQLAFDMLSEYSVIQKPIMPSTPPSLRPRHGALRRNARGLPINAREHTSEAALERDLRRRRREAMVINEGDRPVSQEDVYMRDRSGRMSSEFEREARESGDMDGSLLPRPVEDGSEAEFRAALQARLDSLEH
ncbi:hypothetical protein K491DRAFT_8211 [Lophiostoma macrostomum CBS 122681]|uniref:Uncharacterized protein n=1 Tax=Lophiostoma macrostomum CBS 122681 TaxID=1314788 RepID=A0A6A6TUV3_9PLEO|nr:hypothetical protein K491DRAFT_8211 [Lophiostoma macrostomum CBS 122681]